MKFHCKSVLKNAQAQGKGSWEVFAACTSIAVEQGSLIAEWRAKTFKTLSRIISNDDGVLFIYFIKMKDCILKQRGLCELIEIAETLSIQAV